MGGAGQAPPAEIFRRGGGGRVAGGNCPAWVNRTNILRALIRAGWPEGERQFASSHSQVDNCRREQVSAWTLSFSNSAGSSMRPPITMRQRCQKQFAVSSQKDVGHAQPGGEETGEGGQLFAPGAHILNRGRIWSHTRALSPDLTTLDFGYQS